MRRILIFTDAEKYYSFVKLDKSLRFAGSHYLVLIEDGMSMSGAGLLIFASLMESRNQ